VLYDNNMNKKEKEKLIRELHDQGMTYAQIAKKAHVSLRDIGPILHRGSQSVSSQALELYSQQKTPLDVAMTLGIDADEALHYNREYYKLLGCSEFVKIYPEIKDDAWSYVNLVKAAKNEKMGTAQIVNLLKIANNDLPSIENRLQELERKESILLSNHQQAVRNLKGLNAHISEENEKSEQLRSESDQLKGEVRNLKIEKIKLENAISSFKFNNESTIRIKETVRKEIENLQSNPRRLIRCALASIFQSEINHPGRLMTLYYNNPPILSVERILSISQKEQSPNQASSHEDSIEKLLLDEAEQALNRIEESLANKCLSEITNDTSEMLPVLNMPHGSPINESRSRAIDVSINDAESPYIHDDFSLDKIQFGRISSNWAEEFCNRFGIAVGPKNDEMDARDSRKDQQEQRSKP
jgi:DNA repair exonuclease SbcCD ATPase subunit